MLKKKSNNEYYLLYSGNHKFCETLYDSTVPKAIQDNVRASFKNFAPELMLPCPIRGLIEIINKTILLISLNGFPIPWDKSQIKYVVTLTTLKKELMGKAEAFFDVVSINKKRRN
jgi:hypothetical protein